MPEDTDRKFRLGPWTVNPGLGELSGPGGVARIEPRAMQVLVQMARNVGDVVRKDRFFDAVWAGRVVGDEVLSRCISILRTELGDDAKNPRYIKTVPRIGYLLVCDVEWLGDEPQAEPGDDDRARERRFGSLPIVLGLLALAAVAVVAYVFSRGADTPPGMQRPDTATLVVLPFANMSEDSSNEFLSDGLTEDLIGSLARLPGITVMGSATTFAYKDTALDTRGIAEQLAVGNVLQGSVRRSGDRVRVYAELADGDSGIAVWSKNFDTEFSDIFRIQDEISAAIVDELRPQLSGETPPRAAPTRVMAAYELVLRGRFQLRKRNAGAIRQGIALFEQALDLDPRFGEAYEELARAYAVLPTYSGEDPEAMFRLAESAIKRGVAADPSIDARVNDIRAFLHFSRWEWIEAEADFRRALEATPNDPNLYQWYSQHLAAVGETERALEAALKAKQLDRLSPVTNQRLAIMYVWLNDDARALEQFQLAFELGLDTRANREIFAILLIRLGRFEPVRESLLDIQRSYPRAPDWIDPFVAALADSSKRDSALAALRSVAADGQVDIKYLQGALAYLGDADGALEAAFELLEDPLEFELEYFFGRENDDLRRQPRFGELIERIGLVDYWDAYGWTPFCERRDDRIVCR